MMSPKEQLSRIPQMNQRIDQRVLNSLSITWNRQRKMGGALKEICVKGSGSQSPMSDWVDKAIDLGGRYWKEVEDLRAERRLVCGIVDRIRSTKTGA